MSNSARSAKTHQVAVTGMLCAISFIAVLLGNLIPNFNGFLSYDPKDAVIAIAGFIYGPISAILITVVVSVIEMFTISATGIYGCIMNIVSTLAFAVPGAFIYKKNHSMKGAVIGLGVGVVCVTIIMVLWNYIITPFYMGQPREVVAAMLLPVFMPFNLIKGGINAGLTLVLYKPLVTALRKARLLPKAENSGKASFHLGFTIFSVAVLVTFVLLFLVLIGVL